MKSVIEADMLKLASRVKTSVDTPSTCAIFTRLSESILFLPRSQFDTAATVTPRALAMVAYFTPFSFRTILSRSLIFILISLY